MGFVACGDDLPPEPEPEPSRTILVHQQNTGTNLLLSTDGRVTGSSVPDGLLPIGAGPGERIVAALTPSSDALVLVGLNTPDRLDTIIRPMPTSHSLAAFSNDEQFVALVSYVPERVVLLYDRASQLLDSLPYGNAEPALPPIMSPDNERIALITVTDLSIFIKVLFRNDRARSFTERFGFSRILNRPLFGWPRWTDEGLLIGFLRAGQNGPDTIMAGFANPDNPNQFLVERYRAVMSPVSDARPEVLLGLTSTYAFSPGGQSIVIGAEPGTGPNRHAIYLVTPDVGRIQLLLDDPAQFPMFPLFID